MNTVALVSFLIGLLRIGWVVLANAEASARWYGSDDRKPFIEDRLIRLRLEKKRNVSLDNRRSLGHVWDRLKSLDEKTANRLPKDQPFDNRQEYPSDPAIRMAPASPGRHEP
jgi:hypothetical protein